MTAVMNITVLICILVLPCIKSISPQRHVVFEIFGFLKLFMVDVYVFLQNYRDTYVIYGSIFQYSNMFEVPTSRLKKNYEFD